MADQALSINPKETALIVVDMQNDFCHRDGFYARNAERMMSIGLDPDLVTARIAPMKELLAASREAGLFIVHTQIVRDLGAFDKVETLHKIVPLTYQAYEDAPDGPPLVPDSWGAATHDELAPLPGEQVLVKKAFSSFYQTDLEMTLRRRGIRTIILAGTVTYVCVLHTAFDASVRDFDVIMASDGVASWAPELQEPVLRMVDLVMGTTLPGCEIADLLKRAAAVG